MAIQEKKRTDLQIETRSIRARPTVTLKVLRAFLGRVNFIAGLVVYLRAIVTWLWHAVNAREDEASRHRPQAAGGRKPLASDRIHTRRLLRPLDWLDAFLSGREGAIARTLSLTPEPRTRFRVTCDASPWGFGAILYENGVAVEWLAEALTSDDEAVSTLG